MRAVAKNTFYKATTINQSLGVKPNYADLSDGGTNTSIELKGGTDPTYFLISGAVASTPAYGESELIGGYMQLYTSNVTMPTTPSLPQLSLYRTKPGTEMTEGTVRLSYISGSTSNDQTGHDITVYRSTVADDNYYTIENFDGADKTIGQVKMIDSLGNGTTELSDAYLTLSDAKNKAHSLGNILGSRKEFALKQYFAADEEKVPISPEDDPTGVWRPIQDRRQGSFGGVARTTMWKKPYWKYKDISGKIKFQTKDPVGSDLDAAPLATKGNTIFDEVYATTDMNNPFTSDKNNPLMMTSCELNSAKKYSGGQAFRMYHLWDYSTQSAQLQKAMGGRQILPSMTRASIYNLPRPHAGLDNALFSNTSSVGGWTSVAAPSIEMRMNISKLGWNPFMAKNSSYGLTSYYSYYDSGSTMETGGSTDQQLGFLRSVAITFSNYKPKPEHTTLDRFLDYGLSRFYGSSSLTTEHVVGGVVFSKSPIDISLVGGDPSVVTAMAIPVTPYSDGSANTVLKAAGLGKFGFSSGEADQTLLLASQPVSSNDVGNSAGTSGSRKVSIPMDSWFNMKFFMDGYAKNSTTSAQNNIYNYNDADLEGKGVPMRLYFETETDTTGDVETTATQNIPFIDIFFPAVSGSSSSGSTNRSTSYSFNDDPSMFPKHMTVWVQNYRWIQGIPDTSDLPATNNYDGSFNMFYWGDDDAGLLSGSAIEAEIFIDDIKLKNFTPEVTNCSAGASISTQQYFQTASESQISPWDVYTTDDDGGGPYSLRGWAVSGQSVSGNMTEYSMPESLIFGFENPAQLPNKTDYANDAYGYLLANGFSTNIFKNINRLDSASTVAHVSVSGTKTNQKYLGGQFFGAHYWDIEVEDNNFYNTTLSGSDINFSTTSDTVGKTATGSVNLMTGTTVDFPSQDGFTQKGLFRFAMSGAGFNGDNTWTKRENISVATKITGIMGAGHKMNTEIAPNAIQVANTAIFNKYMDEEFIIFKIGTAAPGASAPSGNANTLGWGVGSDEATAWPNVTTANRNVLKLADDAAIDEGAKVITFRLTCNDVEQSSIIKADDRSTDLLTEANLSDLWIGPKKYWLNLTWMSGGITQRSYQNFCIIQNVEAAGTGNAEPTAASMQGSTWNESIFSFDSSQRGTVGRAGLYLRSWNLSTNIDDSTLLLNQDYGYGVYSEEDASGGQVSQANAALENWVELDMMGLAKVDGTEQASITFLLGLANASSDQTVTIASDENATIMNRPHMYWEYLDKTPSFRSPLSVEPNYNILSGSGNDKVNLYELDREELNAVKFTWEEEGDDILYRLLYIDTNPITDKYDGIYFHAPINEIPGTNSKATGNYYLANNRTANSFNTETTRHITGSSGWSFVGTGNAGEYIRTATGWDSPWFGATEATFIAHVIPNATGAGTATHYIMSDYDTTTAKGSFNMKVTKAAGAGQDVVPVFTLVSGNGGYSGKEYTLTSDYSFKNDNESPLFIVVTFDASLPTNCLKMYVNGMLVKQSAGGWAQNTAIYDGTGYTGAQFVIGYDAGDSSGTGYLWRGGIQECIVHKKCLHVPTSANQYILPTDFLPDMDSGTEIKYNARLFLFDYHNIIGSSTDNVCTSNEVTWEATGV